MATPSNARRGDQKSLPTLVSELWQLAIAYLKQETINPIKGLLRFIAFGIAGSALLSLGLLLWVLALLRSLQTETGSTFTGNLSWVPYVLTLAACVVVAGLAVRSIGSAKRKGRR